MSRRGRKIGYFPPVTRDRKCDLLRNPSGETAIYLAKGTEKTSISVPSPATNTQCVASLLSLPVNRAKVAPLTFLLSLA